MYRTVAQLDSVMEILSLFFPQLCTRVQLPNASVEGRPIYALRMRGGSGSFRRGVLIIGGMHARELMNPDAIADLQLDLVRCYLNETGLVLGGKSFSAPDIKVMVETLDIWMLPCANPDGREYVMNVDDLWRKNRRDNPGTPCDGVDLNRNLDIVWGVVAGQTSCSPCADTFVGASAFSEPETLNIKYLCDTYQINVFVDVHSFSELVLFPWGHAPTQTTDPSQVFSTLATGTCAGLNPPGYQEYMSPSDLLRYQTVSQRIVDGIHAVRGRNYTPEPSRALYPTTGTSCDYVYSRYIANPSLQKTYGFSFETGPFTGDAANSFHPADPTMVKQDAKAGILTLMQQSICAIDLIGTMALTSAAQMQAFRTVRDQLLATTPAGREWIAVFERIQIPFLAAVFGDPSLAREATELLQRTGELVARDDAIVTDRDVKRTLGLLDAVARRDTLAAQRRDLVTVRAQLAKMRGKRMRSIIEELLGPRRPTPKTPRRPARGSERRRR
jgi:murein tripeptide amidase MpaA